MRSDESCERFFRSPRSPGVRYRLGSRECVGGFLIIGCRVVAFRKESKIIQ